ncbi:MAG: hypothetical protein K8J09_11025 [Planctomycetes bacterium]|nr:hypothetical protein [Planctomycetota bacterium]MCC7396501.1 hypothetical protein [Planctomycetota bacterium]
MLARASTLLAALLLTACVSTFDPDDDHLVVGSQTWPTPFVVADRGPVIVHMRRGQVGEHADGVHRAWRVETTNGQALSPWLTTTPMVTGQDELRVHVSRGGTVFAFDPGAAIDSRDQQRHRPAGWYRVGRSGLVDLAFDRVEGLADGGVHTFTKVGPDERVRSHDAEDHLRGERALLAGSLRPLDDAHWLAELPGGGGKVLLDATLEVRGHLVAQASAPAEFFVVPVPGQITPAVFGLSEERALVSPQGTVLPGPWQKAWALADRDCVVVVLLATDGRLTLVEPDLPNGRVLLREATFVLLQTRTVPPEYADAEIGASTVVLLAGQAQSDAGYALFARLGGRTHGPFTGATSEAATAAMWAGLLPVVQLRRADLAQQRAAVAAAAERARAELQQAIDAAKALLAEVARHQDAYFEALQAGNAGAADGAIVAIDQRIAGLTIPAGHADSDTLRRAQSLAAAYRLDWELRREDRTIERIAHWGHGYLAQGGALYSRYARVVGRMLAVRQGIPRPTYDLLQQTSHGFSAATQAELRRNLALLEQFEAGERYRAHLAAGRFQDAHDIAYQLGFEGWVEHLLGPAKGRLPDSELEALLHIARDRAAEPELRARLEAAHHSQWLAMVAAQRREQFERFRQQEAEDRRAEAGRAMAEREARAQYRLEALRRGFVWREN